MYNKVVLVGRISADLELRQTNNGKWYCRFHLAVNRMNEGADFIPVTVWNKSAENLVQYQGKGSLVLIDGSISMNNYTDKDGNKRISFEVITSNVQFLGVKKNTEDNDTENNNEETDPFEEFGNTVEIDENFLD